jgi:hypothetical protein
MHKQTPTAPRPTARAALDPDLRAFTRDWFDKDLQARIDAAMDLQVALLLVDDCTPSASAYAWAA